MACGETARFSEPYDSLMNLERPDGWTFRQARSMSIAENWNVLGATFLATDADWLFLTNDDHVYPPDTLRRLLAHDKDVVTGLYLTRQAPFRPVLFDDVTAAGGLVPRRFMSSDRGLKAVAACGDGCLLLRRSVLETIPAPWWALANYHSDACDHDNAFCAKVRAAGFDIWCDFDMSIGHLGVMPVFPFFDGHWRAGVIAGTGVFEVPVD